MDQEIVKLSPDALGYKDRGKMKWMGMMLSDHAEALKKQKQHTRDTEIHPKKKQTMEVAGIYLYHSYYEKRPLSIQLDIIKDGRYLSDVEGIIVGFQEDFVYINQRNNQTKQIRLEDIRHAQWIDTAQWYEKYQKQSITV